MTKEHGQEKKKSIHHRLPPWLSIFLSLHVSRIPKIALLHVTASPPPSHTHTQTHTCILKDTHSTKAHTHTHTSKLACNWNWIIQQSQNAQLRERGMREMQRERREKETKPKEKEINRIFCSTCIQYGWTDAQRQHLFPAEIPACLWHIRFYIISDFYIWFSIGSIISLIKRHGHIFCIISIF